MIPPFLAWGAALAGAAWILLEDGSGPGAAPGRRSGAVNPRDQNAIARMIYVELRGGGTWEEKVGMGQVAVNRAFEDGCTALEAVVTGACGGAWSGDTATYNRLLAQAMPTRLDWEAAAAALSGSVNVVGPRTHFVHPRNAGFNSPSAKRPIADRTGRFVPLWSISRSYSAVSPLDNRRYSGRAEYEPMWVGRTPTLFS